MGAGAMLEAGGPSSRGRGTTEGYRAREAEYGGTPNRDDTDGKDQAVNPYSDRGRAPPMISEFQHTDRSLWKPCAVRRSFDTAILGERKKN